MKRALITLSAALLCACGNTDGPVDMPVSEAVEDTPLAGDTEAMQDQSFTVYNSAGNAIGSVGIADVEDGVVVRLNVTAIPEGEHAIHFHEVGRCDGPDFTSSGGHYNPSGHNHGFEASEPNPHAGDMPNFDAPASGLVNIVINNERVTLSGRSGYAPLLDADGTALIIHAGADDYVSQPSGDAGGRIACAVIGG